MEERQQPEYTDDVIYLGQYWAALRSNLWKIALLSLAVGLVTLIVMFQLPNIYQATAVLTPATDEKKQIPSLGALASFGIDVGGPSKVEDLETLFKSNDLTVRVFTKDNVWPVVLAGRYEPASGKMKVGWLDRILGTEKEPRPPDDWDAILAAKKYLTIVVNKKAGTLSISFDSQSAEGSASIVRYYLEEGKNRLQEEALERAASNKKFVVEQIGKTMDTLTRDRLYSLYGQEVEREMLARNREQFGFRVIDTPRVPKRIAKPRRAITSLLTMALSFLVWGGIFIRHERKSDVPRKGKQNG